LDANGVEAAVRCVLSRHAPGPGSVEVALLTSDEIADLNLRTRGVTGPTDVLSFPGPDFAGAPLGEVAVSIEHALEGAKVRGLEPTQEAMFLAAHGTLHLCGFEDETEDGREEMIRLANEALAELGVPEQPTWESLAHPGAN